jgi:hypothetical protein
VSLPTTQPHAPGWYADPAGGHGLRWWDGTDWTGRRSFPSRDAKLVPLGPRFARLSDILGALLLVNTGWSLLTLAVEARDHHENVSQGLALGALALVALTALFWCAWQWRLAVSSPDELRRGPRGQLLGWVVPVANLWMPPQNLNDLWHAYEPHDAHGRGRGISLVFPWWICWLVSAVVGGMGLRTLLEGHAPEAQISVAWTLAAVLAWVVVRRLSWRALVYHVAHRPS